MRLTSLTRGLASCPTRPARTHIPLVQSTDSRQTIDSFKRAGPINAGHPTSGHAWIPRQTAPSPGPRVWCPAAPRGPLRPHHSCRLTAPVPRARTGARSLGVSDKFGLRSQPWNLPTATATAPPTRRHGLGHIACREATHLLNWVPGKPFEDCGAQVPTDKGTLQGAPP